MKLTSIAAVIGFIVLSSSTLASDRLMDGPADTDSIRVGSYNIMASRMGRTTAAWRLQIVVWQNMSFQSNHPE